MKSTEPNPVMIDLMHQEVASVLAEEAALLLWISGCHANAQDELLLAQSHGLEWEGMNDGETEATCSRLRIPVLRHCLVCVRVRAQAPLSLCYTDNHVLSASAALCG